MRTPLALLASIFLVGCVPSGPTGASTTSSITGGSTDSSDPAVAMVLGMSQDGSEDPTTCSGTFLAPRIVLTAAHCLEDSSLTMYVGPNDSYSLTDAISVPTGMFAVDSSAISPAYDPTSAAPHPHDLAVLFLSSNVGKASLPVHAGAPDSTWIGAPVRIVGYGRTSMDGPDDARRAVSTAFSSFGTSDLVISNGDQDCGGDSGGPAIMNLTGNDEIFGLSAAATRDCSTAGYYDRIDADVAFIQSQIGS